MKTDNILIEEKDIEFAQNICNDIENSDIRNRSVANVLAAKIAQKGFDERYDIDIESGLHNIGRILNDIDISDIYINSGYVDVRLFFKDNEMCVPKSHFDNNMLPLAYMFIKLSEDLSNGTIVGFIKPKDIDLSNLADGNYFINPESLSSFYDIESIFSSTVILSDIEDIEIYSYIDGSIENKQDFYKKLLTSKIGRLKLAKVLSADTIFSELSTRSNISSANTDLNSPADDNESLITDEEFNDLLNFTDNSVQEETETAQEYEQELNEADLDSATEYSTVVSPSLKETMKQQEDSEAEQQIDSLFKEKTASNSSVNIKNKKKRSNPILVLMFLIILCTGGYYGYQYYMSGNSIANLPEGNDIIQEQKTDLSTKEANAKEEEPAMPIESIDKAKNIENTQEGNSVTIPAIEQNLGASITVSNLKIDWDVPAGYVSNTAAKRYLVKIGKIIQLNLKTELMLMSKVPITNKILVEIKYNDNYKKFEAVGLLNSSGEKSIDDAILKTISDVLNMSTSSGTESFSKLQGNPTLVIHL